MPYPPMTTQDLRLSDQKLPDRSVRRKPEFLVLNPLCFQSKTHYLGQGCHLMPRFARCHVVVQTQVPRPNAPIFSKACPQWNLRKETPSGYSDLISYPKFQIPSALLGQALHHPLQQKHQTYRTRIRRQALRIRSIRRPPQRQLRRTLPSSHATTASPNVVTLERAGTNGIRAPATVQWPSRRCTAAAWWWRGWRLSLGIPGRQRARWMHGSGFGSERGEEDGDDGTEGATACLWDIWQWVKWNKNGEVYEPSVRFVKIRKASITSPSAPRPFSTALRIAIVERAIRGKIRS